MKRELDQEKPEYILIWGNPAGNQTKRLGIPSWQKTKFSESRKYAIAGVDFNNYLENEINVYGKFDDKNKRKNLSDHIDNIHYTSHSNNPHITIVFEDESRIYYYFRTEKIVISAGPVNANSIGNNSAIDVTTKLAYKIYHSIGISEVIKNIFDRIIVSEKFQRIASDDISKIKIGKAAQGKNKKKQITRRKPKPKKQRTRTKPKKQRTRTKHKPKK